MAKKLLIVEAPSKARHIQEILGNDYIVKATLGHIRELPEPRKMTPEQKEKYGSYAQDVNDNFSPLYKPIPGKSKTIGELKKLAKTCDEVILATDPDSEGAAIAWHLLEVLPKTIPTYRATWNEITEPAVREGLKKKELIDRDKGTPLSFYGQAESALARGQWDRLFGFRASPLAWRLKQGTSAGRVQTPGVRLVVEREERRLAFISTPFYTIYGTFEGRKAKLYSYRGEKIADSSKINDEGKVSPGYRLITDKDLGGILEDLESFNYTISQVSSKPYRRTPPPPFTTSSALQSIGSKARLTAKNLTSILQGLYQGSHTTYIRTVSVEAAPEAIKAARAELKKNYPSSLLPTSPRIHKDKKAGNSGHECIRPVLNEKTGNLANPRLNDSKEQKVFDLIRLRFLASQSTDQVGTNWGVEYSSEDQEAIFRANEIEIHEPGWTAIYELDEEVGA